MGLAGVWGFGGDESLQVRILLCRRVSSRVKSGVSILGWILKVFRRVHPKLGNYPRVNELSQDSTSSAWIIYCIKIGFIMGGPIPDWLFRVETGINVDTATGERTGTKEEVGRRAYRRLLTGLVDLLSPFIVLPCFIIQNCTGARGEGRGKAPTHPMTSSPLTPCFSFSWSCMRIGLPLPNCVRQPDSPTADFRQKANHR